MKRILFSLLVLLTSLSACAGEKKSEDNNDNIVTTSVAPFKAGYKIEVKIKNIAPGSELILANYLGDKPYKRDSAFVNAKGIATFEGKDTLERGIYMVLLPGRSYFEIIISNNNYFTIETDTTIADYYERMVITNSPENQRFMEYNKYLQTKGKAMQAATDPEVKKAIDADVREYKKKYMEANPNDLLTNVLRMMEEPNIPDAPKDIKPDDVKKWQYNYYVAHYWDNVNFKESGLVRTPGGIFQGILDRFFDKVLSQDSDTLIKYIDDILEKVEGDRELQRFVIWHLTRKYETSKVMCHDGVFSHVAKQTYCKGKAFWADSTLVNKICEKADKIAYTACKTKVPDLRLADVNDNYKHLYAEKAKFTVIFFWDPTCGHCKKVIPKLVEMKKAFGDTIKIYAVGTEGKYEEWLKYVNTHPEMNVFTNVCKTDRYFPWPINKQNYDITSNPIIFLLDEDKKVLAKKIDENKLEEFMIYIMGEQGLITREQADARINAIRAKQKPEDGEEEDTGS